MIADDLGDEREAEPAAAFLGGHEGIEQKRQEVRGHAGARVADADFERQADALARPRHRQPHAGPIGGRQMDLAIRRLAADGLGGVLDQIEKHLDQLGRDPPAPAAARDRNPRRSGYGGQSRCRPGAAHGRGRNGC